MAGSDPREQEMRRQLFGKGDACLSADAIAAIASSTDGAPADPVLRSHVESCSHCRNEVALLRMFESGEPSPEEVSSVDWIASELGRRPRHRVAAETVRPWWSSVASWFAQPGAGWRTAAAMASLAVVIAAALYVGNKRGGDFGSASSESYVWRSTRVEVLRPAGDVAAAPAEFEWRELAGATEYHVRLLAVDRNEIWSADTAGTHMAIPAAVRSRLSAGRSFLWQVTAKNPAGVTAESNLQTFHISLITPR